MTRPRQPSRPGADEVRPRLASRPDTGTSRLEQIDRLAREYVQEFREHSSRPPPQDPAARAIYEMESRLVGVFDGIMKKVESLDRTRDSMREFGFELSDTGSFKVVDERSLDATLLRKELVEAKEKLVAREAELASIHADEKKRMEKWGDRRFDIVIKVGGGIIAALVSMFAFLFAYVWAHIPH